MEQTTWPAAPSGLSSTGVTSTTSSFSFTDNSTGETFFEFQVSIVGTDNWVTKSATIAAGSSTYTATGLEINTQYDARVRALIDGGYSAWSNVCSFKTSNTAPAAPTIGTPAPNSTDAITIIWTASGSNQFRFRLRYKLSSSETWTELTVGLTVTSYRFTGLVAATSYDFQMRAENDLGNSSWSNLVSATTGSGRAIIPSFQANGDGLRQAARGWRIRR